MNVRLLKHIHSVCHPVYRRKLLHVVVHADKKVLYMYFTSSNRIVSWPGGFQFTYEVWRKKILSSSQCKEIKHATGGILLQYQVKGEIFSWWVNTKYIILNKKGHVSSSYCGMTPNNRSESIVLVFIKSKSTCLWPFLAVKVGNSPRRGISKAGKSSLFFRGLFARSSCFYWVGYIRCFLQRPALFATGTSTILSHFLSPKYPENMKSTGPKKMAVFWNPDAHTKRLLTKRLLDKTSPNKTSP